MKVVMPFDVTDSSLIETNIPQDDFPEYNPATEYEQGDRVIIASEKSIYELASLDPVTGVSPLDQVEPPVWFRVGATNRWRMFDQVIGSATIGRKPFDASEYSVEGDDTITDGIAFRVRTNIAADTIALFNLSGLHVDIIVRTSEGTEYERRFELGGQLTNSNWYAYFYQPLERRDEIVITDLPPIAEKDIFVKVVEVDNNPNDPQVGEVAIGRQVSLGRSLYGTGLDFQDFSTKERDQFGNFQIVERAYADVLEVDLSIPNDEITFVKRTIASLRAKPAVWIAGECIEGTTVYGYPTRFNVVISGPIRSDATLTIEGLI